MTAIKVGTPGRIRTLSSRFRRPVCLSVTPRGHKNGPPGWTRTSTTTLKRRVCYINTTEGLSLALLDLAIICQLASFVIVNCGATGWNRTITQCLRNTCPAVRLRRLKSVGMIEVTPLHPIKTGAPGWNRTNVSSLPRKCSAINTTRAWRPREESNPSLVAYKTSALSLSYRANLCFRVDQSQRISQISSHVEQ